MLAVTPPCAATACLATSAIAGGVAAGAAGTGACGAGCGGEAAGPPVMSWVGSGRGDYSTEMTYKFIGEGQGEFDLVAPKRTNYCLFILPCLFLLALLLLLLLLCPWGTTTTTALYDCSTGAATWQTSWSVAQQAWCCQTAGRACTVAPTTAAPTATAPFTTPATTPPLPPPTSRPPVPPPTTPPPPPQPYDCNYGGVDTWPPEKRMWCCTHYKNGCPTLYPPPTPPPLPYDCAAGFENWVVGWSVEKKQWCCTATGKGCPAAGGCQTTLPVTPCPTSR